ncbi:MAG: hypothetical protein AAF662_02640 [Pseudomonadota bacterium]
MHDYVFRRSATLNWLRWGCATGICGFSVAALIYHPLAAPMWIAALVFTQRMVASLDPDSVSLLPPLGRTVWSRGSYQDDDLDAALIAGVQGAHPQKESVWFSRIDTEPFLPCTVTCLARANGFLWLEVSPIAFACVGPAGGVGPAVNVTPSLSKAKGPCPSGWGWFSSLLTPPGRSAPLGSMLVFADAMNDSAWRSLRRDLRLMEH